MTAEDIITSIEARGGLLAVSGGKIRCVAPADTVTASDCDAIRSLKPELLALLATAWQWNGEAWQRLSIAAIPDGSEARTQRDGERVLFAPGVPVWAFTAAEGEPVRWEPGTLLEAVPLSAPCPLHRGLPARAIVSVAGHSIHLPPRCVTPRGRRL